MPAYLTQHIKVLSGFEVQVQLCICLHYLNVGVGKCFVFCGTAQEETSESPCLTAPKLSTNSNTITPVRGITSGAQVSCVCSPRRILSEN